MTGAGALQGVRVLDLSRILAGPLCAQMLADHGAQVVKVEAPQGDETRRWGPPFVDDDRTSSAYYQGMNRSKDNIALDLGSPVGREVLHSLLSEADVVVENFKTGTMARWGLGYEERLAAEFPDLVYCRITGYGTDGPLGGLPGYDAVLQSYSGLMSVNGDPDGDPLRVGIPLVDLTAAHQAFAGVLLALLARATGGTGQLVDITLLDAAVSIMHPHAANHLCSGEVPIRTGAAHPSVTPYQVFGTGTDPLFVAAASDAHFAALAEEIGRSDLVEDPRFRHNGDRTRNRALLVEQIEKAVADRDASELGRGLAARGVPASSVQDVAQALASPQVRHRDMVVDDDGYRGLGVPIKLGASGSAPVRRPSAIGEDTDRVLARHGLSVDQVAELRRRGAFGPP
ncbi:carnitine dehydratase (plasmid) [Pseudonocardia sp. EC080610-09]|uniref:CaiB/BaiF CoA transferase family protein n=1 Tax=unclassified Pseudonocardia TaxID=2619320 RepID=UPI000705BDFC|nr:MULTISPECIES: CoA transferase [unclassified Pseudonocardia]ALL79300.1 carnitine dehydratase [Pseudonocardia sp. EC080610-09]ALL85270.1 carnitine dehydratase [Pseudonocardia sp. EC080619-01]